MFPSIGSKILEIEIPGRCYPLKNSKQIIVNNGKRLIIPSKNYYAWSQSAKGYLMVAKGKSKYAFPYAEPVHVRATFYYDRSPCDLDNALSSISEVLQNVCVITDDQLIYSYDGSRRYGCSRGKSRTFVEVFTFEENCDAKGLCAEGNGV